MIHSKRFIPIFFILICLVFACTTTEPTLVVPKEMLVTADANVMYPTLNSELSTAYPIWEYKSVEIPDLTPPLDVPIPPSGKASISGLLYAYDISVPLSEITFVFMPAADLNGTPVVPPIITYGNPDEGDVICKTDENGLFTIDEIAPGLYYLVINYPDRSEIAVESDNTTTNRLFEFEADKSYLLGVIKILS